MDISYQSWSTTGIHNFQILEVQYFTQFTGITILYITSFEEAQNFLSGGI